MLLQHFGQLRVKRPPHQEETAKVVTLETLEARIAKELEHGRVEIAPLVNSYSPHDISRRLTRLFRLL